MRRSNRVGKAQTWMIGVVLIAACGIAVYVWSTGNGENGGPNGGNGLRAELEAEIQQAEALWIQGDLKKAKEACEDVRERIAKEGKDEFADLLDQVERQLKRIRDELDPPGPAGPIEVPKPGDPPPPVTEDDLLRYYPTGPKIQSRAQLRITGSGTNERWLLKGESNFLYEYRVAAETIVEANDGRELRFRKRFPEVVQQRAVCESTVQLRPAPPHIETLFRVFEDQVLETAPAYVVVRKAAQIANTVDPGLKRTLTRLYEEGKEVGWWEDEKVEVAVQIEELQGAELRVSYRSGWGVTQIEATGKAAERFSETDLKRIAHGSSLLMDYYIFPGVNKGIGDEWKVQVERIAGLFNLYDAELEGEIALKREDDKDGLAVLRLLGGEVYVRAETEAGERAATLRPKSGTLWFSPSQLFIQKGRMNWHASDEWFSKDHLLFGTRQTRDLEMTTDYHARRVDNVKKAAQ